MKRVGKPNTQKMKKIYGDDSSNPPESIPEELIEDGNKAKKRDSKYKK